MVRIRLRRAGGKGKPTHRLVATDRESPRDGKFIEILGDYNPRTQPATIRIKEDRVYYWLSVGAQPSNSVKQLFRTVGLMDRYQRFKDGEDIAVLTAEATQLENERNQDDRTRRDDLVKVGTPKKKAEPVVEEAAEPAAVEGEETPAVVEAEAAVEETPEAAAEAVQEPAVVVETEPEPR